MELSLPWEEPPHSVQVCACMFFHVVVHYVNAIFVLAGISQLENHGAPVVSVSSVSVTPHTVAATSPSTPSSVATGDTEGLTFQVASIDR